MVSTSNAQQTNALIVSNPLIITSSASNHLTHNTNMLTSIAAQNTMSQSTNQQSFLHLLQNQQRSFLYSHPQIAPQMFLPGHNQLLATKTGNCTNQSSPQAVFIDPNLLAQQQQIRSKSIIIPGQQAANLHSRSHILSGIQANGFLSAIQPITWPPNPPILIPPQASAQQQPLFLHAPVSSNQTTSLQTPILVPHQNGALFVRTSNDKPNGDRLPETPIVKPKILPAKESNKKAIKKQLKETNLAESPTNDSFLNHASNNLKNIKIIGNGLIVKSPKKSKRKLLNIKSPIEKRIAENNERTKQLAKNAHKSTQQMNDELLLKKEKFDEIDKVIKTSKSKKSTGKQEKKRNISIVKPRVLLTHNVSGYLIRESDKPFPLEELKTNQVSVDDAIIKVNEPVDKNVNMTQVDQSQSMESPKLKKLKKGKKSKSLNSDNSNNLNESFAQTKLILPKSSPNQTTEIANKNIALYSKSIYEWSKEEVHEFLVNVSNREFADILLKEEFNGGALALLTIPILRNFGLKLGKILLLIKKIEELRNNFQAPEITDLCKKGNIYEWSVADTYEFISEVASKESAEEFRKQEIDGFSLTLISEDNLRKDLNLAYGPALLIIDTITKLKTNK